MKKILFILIAAILIIGAFVLVRHNQPAPENNLESDQTETTEIESVKDDLQSVVVLVDGEQDTSMLLDQGMIPTKEISGELKDVTDGKPVRDLVTSPNTSGQASAMLFGDSEYHLSVYFENLPAPQDDDFYEGWIVRRGDNFSVLSTGVLELEDAETGTYTNVFSADEDLIDHDFYVLTIEPNDGDPAPADHVLEGVMQ